MREPIVLDNLGGGYVDGLPTVALGQHEFPELRNWLPFGTKLVRRPGVRRLTTTPYAQALNSVFALKENTGAWTVIVGASDGLGRLNGTLITPLSGEPIAASSGWVFLQYLGIGYAFAPGAGLRRFASDFQETAGIAAPTVAPTLVDGAAGSVEAGGYYGIYTYGNTQTGAESNPSPASSLLSHGSNKRITWTFANSPTRQVDCKKLYRVQPNQVDEYFWIATVLGNVLTTYDDNIVIDDFGPPVSWDNGLPPGGLTLGCLWNERIVATDGKRVYLSEAEMPESWAEDSIVEVFEDDGHSIRALIGLGDRCIIGKTNKTHAIVQTGPRKFERFTVSDRHGIWSQRSCCVAESRLIAYGGDNFYTCDGLSMKATSTKQIRRLLDNVPESRKEQVTAEVWEEKSLYVASLPQGLIPENRVLVAYNYRDGTWAPLDHDAGAANTPSCLASVFDSDYGKHIYSTYYDGHLYEFFSGTQDQTDGGDFPIHATLKTKAFLATRPGLKLALQKLAIHATASNLSITLKVFRDGRSTASKTRTASLAGDGWKLYGLSSKGDAGGSLQVGLEYTGADEIELDAMILEVIDVFRPLKAR